jgi:hypothetical protein
MMPKRVSAALIGIAVGTIGLTQTPAAAGSPYTVDSFALGERVRLDRDFQCAAGDQGAGFTWCQKSRQERGKRGPTSSTISLLRNADGVVAYVSRSIEPAFFGPNEMQSEIARLSSVYFAGERAREVRLPRRDGLPAAVIAVWGHIQLQPLDKAELAKLAADGIGSRNRLVDHLGDVRRSAQLGLPVFRLAGGAGYLWSASMHADGRGHLRFLAADASAFVPKPAAQKLDVTSSIQKPAAQKQLVRAPALPPIIDAPATQLAVQNPKSASAYSASAYPMTFVPLPPEAQPVAKPVPDPPANTTVRAKTNADYTGSVGTGSEFAPTPMQWAPPVRTAKDQTALRQSKIEQSAPQRSSRMQTIVWVGLIAAALFLLATVLELWRREPTGLELLAWNEPRAEGPASGGFAHALAQQIASHQVMLSCGRALAAAAAGRLQSLAAGHGARVARLNDLAKSVALRLSTPAARP